VLFEVVFIPAGEFTWGENDDILSIEYNYEIMKYEVTNNQYLTFMEDALSQGFISVNTTTVQGYYSGDEYWDAGIYEFYNLNGNYSRISWDGSFFSVIPGYENHPVNHVSWFGAWAMGEYHGMRLPTEREWEKAARGDTGWDYPWGDEIDGSRANYRDSGDPWDNDTTPIGLYNGQSYEGFQTTDSPSPYGVYDVSGNVWEWTNSFFDDSGNRVLRGGCWINQYTYIQQLKTWTNSFVQNNSGTAYEGFRLMKTIP